MELSKILSNWSTSYVAHEVVYMPPTWKTLDPIPFTFIYVNDNISSRSYSTCYKICNKNNIINPRLFTPDLVQYSSLFHPALFHSVVNANRIKSKSLESFISEVKPLKLNHPVSIGLDVNTVNYYLQSVVFLTGVTLSAALVQNRWSIGTLESKLNRLWQTGVTAEKSGLQGVIDLQICDFVTKQALKIESKPLSVLFEMKMLFSRILKQLVTSVVCEERVMTASKLNNAQRLRFGFIKQLKTLLGKNLQSVIVYGSATNSEKFADYDLIIIVNNLKEGLELLGGKSPSYNGLELNISIFDEEDFWAYQLASGDNLFDHAICLYGEVKVPHKPENDLLARNFSFGFIRLKQLLGMAAHVDDITSERDDKSNLLNYFTKIPLNVSKGIQGCFGNITNNEDIRVWFKDEFRFDVDKHILNSKNGKQLDAISASAWATLQVLKFYDKQNNVCITND
jgi:hypothetical protein